MRPGAIKNKNIFITGGCGFIGSHLMERLVRENRIWCYDNGRRVSPKVKELLGNKRLNFVKGDILDREKLKRSLPRKVDMVFHLAAIAGVSSYYAMPFETMSVNLIGTYNLLESVKDKGVSIFFDFSTSEVYGRYARKVSEESPTSQGPISDLRWTYAISKLASEELSHCYYHKYNLPVVSIRPFNIYGPLQIGEGAVQIFVSNALKNRPIVVNDDGSQVRAWCYIDDLIDGVFACAAKRNVSIGNVFNIGNPHAKATTLELARMVKALTKSGSDICFKKRDQKDIEYRVPSISKAKKLLGYEPKISLREGLKRTIEWHEGLK